MLRKTISALCAIVIVALCLPAETSARGGLGGFGGGGGALHGGVGGGFRDTAGAGGHGSYGGGWRGGGWGWRGVRLRRTTFHRLPGWHTKGACGWLPRQVRALAWLHVLRLQLLARGTPPPSAGLQRPRYATAPA
jgi:hypothetical protein